MLALVQSVSNNFWWHNSNQWKGCPLLYLLPFHLKKTLFFSDNFKGSRPNILQNYWILRLQNWVWHPQPAERESRRQGHCCGRMEHIFQGAWKNSSMLFEKSRTYKLRPGQTVVHNMPLQSAATAFLPSRSGQQTVQCVLALLPSAVQSVVRAPKFNGS